jgi:hypothetical protein
VHLPAQSKATKFFKKSSFKFRVFTRTLFSTVYALARTGDGSAQAGGQHTRGGFAQAATTPHRQAEGAAACNKVLVWCV